jgi:cold shock CspA family protein
VAFHDRQNGRERLQIRPFAEQAGSDVLRLDRGDAAVMVGFGDFGRWLVDQRFEGELRDGIQSDKTGIIEMVRRMQPVSADLSTLLMRVHGTLVKWNDERGFGFIQPGTGVEELFVHISAFPRDGVRPCVGELISFEVDLHEPGEKRAVRVMRAGSSSRMPGIAQRRRPMGVRDRPLTGWFGWAGLLVLGVIGYVGYAKLTIRHAPIDARTRTSVAAESPKHVSNRATERPKSASNVAGERPKSISKMAQLPTQTFRCDDRTRCAQMTSCAEATRFIQQCPGTRMDGDGDGVPCESQWCTDAR